MSETECTPFVVGHSCKVCQPGRYLADTDSTHEPREWWIKAVGSQNEDERDRPDIDISVPGEDRWIYTHVQTVFPDPKNAVAAKTPWVHVREVVSSAITTDLDEAVKKHIESRYDWPDDLTKLVWPDYNFGHLIDEMRTSFAKGWHESRVASPTDCTPEPYDRMPTVSKSQMKRIATLDPVRAADELMQLCKERDAYRAGMEKMMAEANKWEGIANGWLKQASSYREALEEIRNIEFTMDGQLSATAVDKIIDQAIAQYAITRKEEP